ncbi:kama family protein [Corynespora cassiicola Philippines]|uniref:Kama family protein n=1 Tax=Corynespora cassiicola Philippines TaxID=1448308 RepID=A0A2T2N6X9_CORCC|nr:kama family protein [Corynespora cassiicola Philippines]
MCTTPALPTLPSQARLGLPPYKDVSEDTFTNYNWQIRNTLKKPRDLYDFLEAVLPQHLQPSQNPLFAAIRTKQDFIDNVAAGIAKASMETRITPQVLSRIDWENALEDPIRKQFIPLACGIPPNHPKLMLDSLGEERDTKVPGLIQRYPGRALFLALSTCPVYCRFCTRSYAVGGNTTAVSKKPQKPSRMRWEIAFDHIERDASIKDVVVSGGDAYHLQPEHLRLIGERLLRIDHIKRIRFASKGLAVAPCRITDDDPWTQTLIDISNQGRRAGKQVCLHTHFNSPREITWVTEVATRRLFLNGVTMRNQTVLLKGVNDDKRVMEELIQKLADMNVEPYYIYQCDLVPNVEDLRTPLKTIIDLDKYIRGRVSGFMMPSFVVDLPGGGGKRLVSTFEECIEEEGQKAYRFSAPGLPGKEKEPFYYYDPLESPAEACCKNDRPP